MSKRLKPSHLTDDKLKPNGKYLVIELTEDHHQNACTPVPKGTRCITTWGVSGILIRFPHEVLPNDLKVWSDCHLRVLKHDQKYYKPIGRINL